LLGDVRVVKANNGADVLFAVSRRDNQTAQLTHRPE